MPSKIRYFFVLLLLVLAHSAQAQSGCCSSHGGVCGCACCDGTPLSDRCAPYFPCSGIPAIPTGLNVVAQSSSRVLLTWIDNSTNETSFRIESKVSTDNYYNEIGFVGANTTSATITSLAPSTTYYFRVRARGSKGDSQPSNSRAVTTPEATDLCGAQATCFAGNRFKVEARWQTSGGASGNGTVVKLTDDSGYLWFFNASNVEAVFKVINGCSLNHAYWFFAGGLTNVQVQITVTDTVTGEEKTYTNPQGIAFKPIQDTAAFPTCP